MGVFSSWETAVKNSTRCFFLLPFPFNVLLQLQVGRLQAGQRLAQLRRHFVQAGGQHADLVPAAGLAFSGQVQGGHLFGHAADAKQRPGIVPRADKRPGGRDQQNHRGDQGDKVPQKRMDLHRRHRRGIGDQTVGLPVPLERGVAVYVREEKLRIPRVAGVGGEQNIADDVRDLHGGVVRQGKLQQKAGVVLPAVPHQNKRHVVHVGNDLPHQLAVSVLGQKHHHHAVDRRTAHHQQRQHAQKSFCLDALAKFLSQFCTPPPVSSRCSPRPAFCGCS